MWTTPFHRLTHHPSFGEISMTTTGHHQRRLRTLLIPLIFFSAMIFVTTHPSPGNASPSSSISPHKKSPPPEQKPLPLEVSIQGQILSASLPLKDARVFLTKSRRKPNQTPLSLSNPQITDSSGRFSFHILPPSDPGLVYLVIKGGDGGGGQNPDISMIAPVWMANGALPRTPVLRTVNTRIFSTAVATFLSHIELDRIFGDPKRLANLFSQYRGEIDLQSGRFETSGFESSLSQASQTTLSGWANATSLCANHPDTCSGLFLEAIAGTGQIAPKNTLDLLEGAGGFPDKNQDRILGRFQKHSEKTSSIASSRTLSILVTLSGKPLPRSRVTLTAINLPENTQKTVATGLTDEKGKLTLSYIPNRHQRSYLTAWGAIQAGKSKPSIRLISLLPSPFQREKSHPLSPVQTVPIVINELTTLAATYGLKQSFTDNRIDPAPMSAVGFQNGWTLATKLVTSNNGKTAPALSESSLSVTAALLGLCLKQSNPSCKNLFSLLSTPDHPVKDTLEAGLSLSSHPTRRIKTILALLPSPHPLLSDFLLKIILPRSTSENNCQGQQGSIALDSRGSIWEICSGSLVHRSWDSRFGKGLMRISSEPVSEKGPGLLSIDPRGNLWIAQKGFLREISPEGDLPGKVFGGTAGQPLAMAQNPATHTIWIAEKHFLDIFDDQGKLLHRIPGISANALAADDSGCVWASIRNSSLVIELDPEWNIIGRLKRTGGISHPDPLAIDSNGHVWIGNHDPDSLTELSPRGNPTNNSPISGGGVLDPGAIAIDGGNTLWVVNTKGGSLSSFSQDQTPLSPEKGFRGREILGPFGVQIDGSGNIWIENRPGEGATDFISLVVGAATPQTTPLSLSPR